MAGFSSFCTAVTFFFALLSPTLAATLTTLVSKEGKIIVIFKGPIVDGDARQLAATIHSANDGNKFVSGIRLDSPGGNLSEGVALADIVRSAKMATVVPSKATCASACFIVFAAGTEKYVSNNAAVGVHGASENGNETAASSAATITMARVVKDLGVPAAVLGKLVVTPPSEIVWLTPNDLRAMGTTMTGRPAQLAAEMPSQPQQLPSAGTGPIQAKATPPTWDSLMQGAMARSAAQNNGTPAFGRVCQPEFKTCSVGLMFKGANGKSMMAKTLEDIEGKVVSRELCEFNDFGDVRKCVDWDRGTAHTDMKDSSGRWQQVSN